MTSKFTYNPANSCLKSRFGMLFCKWELVNGVAIQNDIIQWKYICNELHMNTNYTKVLSKTACLSPIYL